MCSSRNSRIREEKQVECGKLFRHFGKKLVFEPQLDILPARLEKAGKERGKVMPRSIVRSKRIAVPADENPHSFVTVLTSSPLLFRISSNSGILPTAWVEQERQGS